MDNTVTAKKWLVNAEDDIRWCEASLTGGVWHGACFSAQQSVEKALKAFLLSQGKTIHKIHDLNRYAKQYCRSLIITFKPDIRIWGILLIIPKKRQTMLFRMQSPSCCL